MTQKPCQSILLNQPGWNDAFRCRAVHASGNAGDRGSPIWCQVLCVVKRSLAFWSLHTELMDGHREPLVVPVTRRQSAAVGTLDERSPDDDRPSFDDLENAAAASARTLDGGHDGSLPGRRRKNAQHRASRPNVSPTCDRQISAGLSCYRKLRFFPHCH